MATATPEPSTGQKRAAPGKTQAPSKKQKVESQSTPVTETPPATNSPVPERRRLPTKINEHAPLPTLPEAQPAALSDLEYQSVAASAVLAASLERSRTKWAHDGVFERYWVNPKGYTGKNAKKLPPNNPDVKLQKSKGRCRLRIEPHIIEVDVYMEEKEKPKPVKQQPQYAYGQGTSKKQAQEPTHKGHSQLEAASQPYYQQNRTLPPIQQQARPAPPQPHQHHNQVLPSMQQFDTPARASPIPPQPTQPPHQPPRPAPAASTPQSDKKQSPDPVISMLASRASSDPELKGLMKEVATGSATPEQLTVFQRHIDELTAVIQKKKVAEEEAAAAEAKAAAQQQLSDAIQYDGNNDIKPPPPHQPEASIQPQTATQNPQPQRPYSYQTQQQAQRPPSAYPQPVTYAPPAPPHGPNPVLIQFFGPNASDDRFLFPRHSILETLSPQHTLVSFITTRKGSAAADSTGLNSETEYWQPITMMVEVPYGREEIMNLVRKWVAPVAEVQEHMRGVMGRCERAPEAHLALRLPIKGSVSASELGTPDVSVVEDKAGVEYKKARAAGKVVKKGGLPSALKKRGSVGKEKEGIEEGKGKEEEAKGEDVIMKDAEVEGKEREPGEEGKPVVNQRGRPQRQVRKSVRISEI